MEPLLFPAVFCTGYNSIQETGQACVVRQADAIDFTCDFIPLVPFGTEAQISWALGNRTFATFKGKVYLSSPTLLRLVDVDKDLAQTVYTVFAVNTPPLPARISRASPVSADSTAADIPVEIRYLSLAQLKLCTPTPIDEGETLYLTAHADFLSLHNLVLTVRKKLSLLRSQSLLLCTVESGGNDNFVSLSTYAARLERQMQAEN